MLPLSLLLLPLLLGDNELGDLALHHACGWARRGESPEISSPWLGCSTTVFTAALLAYSL